MKIKIWFLFSIACLLVPYSKAQTQSPAIFPIMQNGKTDFIDKTGKVIIAFKFDGKETLQFNGGLASVSISGRNDFFYIDKTGKE